MDAKQRRELVKLSLVTLVFVFGIGGAALAALRAGFLDYVGLVVILLVAYSVILHVYKMCVARIAQG